MPETYDFIVIGGGSAGLVAAGGAASLGARVALIEKNLLGGDCLYTGCVPSKTLIASAKFAAQLRRAADFGFEISDYGFEGKTFSSITKRVERVIKTIEQHDAPQVFERMGVEVIFGSPQFINPFEIEIKLKNSSQTKRLKSKRFCIATGSRPFIPPIEGLKETGFITNEEVFKIKELPKRLIVLGGGAVGVEIGQSFARFGSRVTVVEMGDRILSKEDEEISTTVENFLRAENIAIRTNTKAVKAHRNENGLKILTVEKAGAKSEIEAEEILIAVGRQPNVDGLNLEKAGVRFDQKQIFTNEYLQTFQKHIFAAGDVTGHFQFTHMADYEAQIVIQNAFVPFPFKKKTKFRVVPWAIFTEPEIARVGLTEREAREKYGEKIKSYKLALTENDRAQTEDATKGFAKIITRKNKIVGAHIVGAHAGEIIHEFVLAMTHNLSLSDLNKAIHIYPTFSKITQAAGREATLETLRSPTVQKWFGRYLKIWR
jgi:pyruvate/2-oxoglutarate dehydrogenase complex dihydrolipoamide dehydrogenase (E3) component